MTPFLGDVVVRARGLARHLLGPLALDRLVRARDRRALGAALDAHGYPLAGGGGAEEGTSAIDAAIARGGQRRLAVLARWLGPRRPLFAVVLEQEDRRLLRILLRHLVADEPAPSPAALGATWALPPRTLASLVRVRSPAELFRLLARAGHAFAPALVQALQTNESGELLALETGLDRAFAMRARDGARRGGALLRAWVAQEIDLQNAWNALLGGSGSFVDGGRQLTRAAHDAVLRTTDPDARRRRLAAAFGDGALAAVLSDPRVRPAQLERHALAARIAETQRVARREPLGAAPILAYALRLRAELSDLRQIHWGLAQGLAPERVADELVGPNG